MAYRRLVTSLVTTAVAVTVALGVGTAASAGCPQRQLHPVDLGTLRGFCCSVANALNDRGEVVGQSAVAGGENPDLHAFVWRHGHMTDLGTLGGASSNATAINAYGDIAGYSQLPDGSTHAVLWHHGHITDLGTLGGDSAASGINDHGVVVGRTVDATGRLVGFRWFAGVMSPLETSDGTAVVADAVNNRGQIAGRLQSPVLPPVRFRAGVATILVDAFGEGTAINTGGDVAGFFDSGTEQAFLWRAGVFTPLASPSGATDTQASGINNRDDVSGFAIGTITRPYWWPRGGAPRLLPGLAGGAGSASDVNNAGQLAGWSSVTATGTEAHAVLWTR